MGLDTDPLLMFAINWDTESCCDEGWIEVSVDGGAFTKLTNDGTFLNWYNDTPSNWWEGSSGGWRDARARLRGTAGHGDVRLRFAFSSDSSEPARFSCGSGACN